MAIAYNFSEAVNNRRSVRSYKLEPLKPETLSKLSEYSKTVKPPFDCATEIRFFKAYPTKELYKMMTSPPDNVAFLSKTDTISIAKTGFVGELVILMAQSLGVSTCWYGHYKLSELQRLMPHLQDASQLKEAPNGFGYSKGITEGVRAICISPLGYYESKGLRLMDRITKNMYSFNRKEIKDLLENPEGTAHLTDELSYALDLARKAPSAANSQMWRFGFEDDYRTVTVAMPPGYRHFKWNHPNVDIGICACHLWLALIERGLEPIVTVYVDSERAVFSFKLN
jgi:nitroreductase